MTQNAFVFGDLSWPMPDFGLVAVWRAMSIDPSRWDDWHGFVEAIDAGRRWSEAANAGARGPKWSEAANAGERETIGAMVDDVAGRMHPSSLQLEITDTGVRLRACLDAAHSDDWKRLGIAWRLAADLGASGEFAWCPCERGPQDVAYHAVIRDYDSRWEVLRGASTRAIEEMAGRREVAALVTPRQTRSPGLITSDVKSEGSAKAASSKLASKPSAKKPAKPANNVAASRR